jgi:hypothetical protein
VGCLTLLAGLIPAAVGDLNSRAESLFRSAQARHLKEPGNPTAAWQFGRACFDLAEQATNTTPRASLAEQGIAACRLALARDSNSAPAHYYLGMNLGQLARRRGLSALKLVDQMEHEFKRARELDEHLEYAGPDRNLGLLYRDAPVIGSVGSRAHAREHLRRAVEVAPGYPENRLNLIEAYSKWGERAGASRELQALEANWASARATFAGEDWAASWADWESRLKRLKKKLEDPLKALGAPRESK